MSKTSSDMPDDELTSVGKSIIREDGPSKVTGTAEFTFDIQLPGMLATSFVRSPHAHAEIKSVDTGAADRMDGVHAALTRDDFPDRKMGDGIRDQPPLAENKVRFKGENVAVIAAETKEIADRAAQTVEVEYERLEPMLDVEEALKEDPPVVVHPDLKDYETSKVLPPNLEMIEKRPNVYQHFEVKGGDVEEGFEESDHVYEDTYDITPVDHACMEPHVDVARPEVNGRLTVWSSCQEVYKVKNHIAHLLGKSPDEIRVIQPYVGGGFGSKEAPTTSPIAAFLADYTGRPVKIANSREEEFQNVTIGGGMQVTIKTGVTDDGDILARKVDMLLPGGAYSSTGYMVARNCTIGVVNNYTIPNVEIESFGVYTNVQPTGSFRGFGNRQPQFALECQLDDIAHDLGIDPVTIRERNVLEEGEVTALKERRTDVSSGKCLAAVAQAMEGETVGRNDEQGPWVRGIGVALGNKYSVAPTASSATIRILPENKVELRYSTDEIGQGATTVMPQIVAEEFGIPVEDVNTVRCDTDQTPFDQGSVSSRSTFNTGNAIRLACDDAKTELFEEVSKKLEIPASDLTTMDGKVFPKGNPEAGIEFRDVFSEAIFDSGYFLEDKGEITGDATWHVEIDPKKEKAVGDPNETETGRLVSFYAEGATVAIVRVNTNTGEVKVEKLIGAFDAGKAINPKLVEEQLRGGMIMGAGMALYEAIEWDEGGSFLNPNFSDYKIPTIHDLTTDVETIILEEAFDEGPYGAKGIGEIPTIPTMPAIANAVRDATGSRIKETPLSPHKVFESLE